MERKWRCKTDEDGYLLKTWHWYGLGNEIKITVPNYTTRTLDSWARGKSCLVHTMYCNHLKTGILKEVSVKMGHVYPLYRVYLCCKGDCIK